MKPGIHPDYHEIEVKMTDGSTFKTRSTYGTPGCTLQLDVDFKTHPAWTGSSSAFLNEKAGRVAKFNERFGGIKFGGAKSEETSQSKDQKSETTKAEESK